MNNMQNGPRNNRPNGHNRNKNRHTQKSRSWGPIITINLGGRDPHPPGGKTRVKPNKGENLWKKTQN